MFDKIVLSPRGDTKMGISISQTKIYRTYGKIDLKIILKLQKNINRVFLIKSLYLYK